MKVEPVSSGSAMGATSDRLRRSTATPARSPRISRSLFGFVVATRSCTCRRSLPEILADEAALQRDELTDARVRQIEQPVQGFAPKRQGLRRALQLDERWEE